MGAKLDKTEGIRKLFLEHENDPPGNGIEVRN